ncbi:hypothetical protein RSO41_14100 [Halomonas sp. I1]|uniref:hypothetical protein n=1 Tax=Halomonas sp. I1 TaxID=393536 RepID=UPI0028DDE4F8|nr:hypothetical protein [Halomonas sp. I1]MDT8895786.1 hypothetical protein [Halomonas sp. I1]
MTNKRYEWMARHLERKRWGEPLERRYFARIELDGECLARLNDATPEAVKARAERIAANFGAKASIHLEQ